MERNDKKKVFHLLYIRLNKYLHLTYFIRVVFFLAHIYISIDSEGNSIDDEHVCNEDAKKTAQLILKETKGCTGCGGLIGIGNLMHYGLVHNRDNSETYLDITRLHRNINHVQEMIVSKLRRNLQHEINEKLRNYRAKYMMNIIDEDKWCRNIRLQT